MTTQKTDRLIEIPISRGCTLFLYDYELARELPDELWCKGIGKGAGMVSPRAV
jgi:hypothetical protein